jgi:hypothetical protein
MKLTPEQNQEMESILDRLVEEKAVAEAEYRSAGHTEGWAWCKAVCYTDIFYALSWDPFDEQIGSLHEHPSMEEFWGSEYFEMLIKRHPLIEGRFPGEVNPFLLEFYRGWQKGVQDFWDMLAKHLVHGCHGSVLWSHP